MKVVLALLVLARVARADEADTAYDEGLKLYDLHEWDAAIAKFKESYKLRPDAPSLFNIAQSFRLKGECGEALGFYRTYKRNYPEAKNLAKVDKFVAEMEDCVAKLPKPEPVKPEPVKPEPVKPEPVKPEPVKPVIIHEHDGLTGRQLGGVVTGAVGIAVAGGGIVFEVIARGKSNQVSSPKAGAVWDPAIQRDGKRYETIGEIALGIGAAAIIGGAVLYVTGRPEAEHVAVIPHDGGATMVWSCAF